MPQLTELVSGPAASLLLSSLQRGLHVDPVDVRGSERASYARKLGKADRRIDWASVTAPELERRLQVLGPLWCEVVVRGNGGAARRKKAQGGTAERVILKDVEVVPAAQAGREWREVEVLLDGGESLGIQYLEEEQGGAVVVGLPAGGAVRIREILVGGKGVRPAARALAPFAV